MNRSKTLLSPTTTDSKENVYVAPRELMQRWQCSRSQVDRIAKREQFTRLLLGRGHNGMVRYLWTDVLKLENAARA